MSESVFKNPLDKDEYSERASRRIEDIRGPYFRDQTAIVHSLPFRRLKHKAQVFFSPNNDHVCTRIEHALHVAIIAATMTRGLNEASSSKLNEDMTYAIGLGHDLGHAPFGHAGERILKKKTEEIGGFIHEIHGLRVVDKLGNRGKSLDLSYGVRDGIICHYGESSEQEIAPRHKKINLEDIKDHNILPSSYEGCVVRMADRIAYLGRDLEDAIYGDFVELKDIPPIIRHELGQTNGEIIDHLIIDVIETSCANGTISLSDPKYNVLKELSEFSDKKIYRHDAILRYRVYCTHIIDRLFDYLLGIYNKWGPHPGKYKGSPVPLDARFGRYLGYMSALYKQEGSPVGIVRDYIAGMTDSYALRCMREISIPEELNFDIPNA